MDDPTVTSGILVVADSGRVSWWSARTAAVPPAELPVAPGIVLLIDPIQPSEPLGWIIEPDTPADMLAEAFGDSVFAAFVEEMRGGEAVHTFVSPRLTASWTRRASVAAAARWTTRTVHLGALLLDKAVSEQAIGHTSAANRLFHHASYALLELGNRCVDGEIGGSAATLVRRAFTSADRAGMGAEIRELGARVAAVAPLDDAELLAVLTAWAEEASDTETEVLVGDTVSERPDPIREHLDLTVIPPRILAWHGRDSRELLIEFDPENNVFALTAALADGVDPTCREARELLAYSADLRTGTLVAVAPAHATDRTITAEIPARGHALHTLTFGLFDAGTDLDTLRRDPLGRALAVVDRDMVEAWNHHRAAVTTLSAATDAADAYTAHRARTRCDEELVLARGAAAHAQDLLSALLDATTEGGRQITATLTARSNAIDAYVEQLWDPAPQRVEELHLLDLIPPNRAED